MRLKIFLYPLLAAIFIICIACGKYSISEVSIIEKPAITIATVKTTNEGIWDYKKHFVSRIDSVKKHFIANTIPTNSLRVISVMWGWDDTTKYGDWGVGIIVPEGYTLNSDNNVTVERIETIAQAAQLTYTGSYMNIGKAYTAFGNWMKQNNTEYTFPTFEEYLTNPNEVKASENITLIWSGFKPTDAQ